MRRLAAFLLVCLALAAALPAPASSQRAEGLSEITFDSLPLGRVDPFALAGSGIAWLEGEGGLGELIARNLTSTAGAPLSAGQGITPARCVPEDCARSIDIHFSRLRSMVEVEAASTGDALPTNTTVSACLTAYHVTLQITQACRAVASPSPMPVTLHVTDNEAQITRVRITLTHGGALAVDNLRHAGVLVDVAAPDAGFSGVTTYPCGLVARGFDGIASGAVSSIALSVDNETVATYPGDIQLEPFIRASDTEGTRVLSRWSLAGFDVQTAGAHVVNITVTSDAGDIVSREVAFHRLADFRLDDRFALGQHVMIDNVGGMRGLPLMWAHDTVLQVFPVMKTATACGTEIASAKARVLTTEGPGEWIPMDRAAGRAFALGSAPTGSASSLSLTRSVNFRIPWTELDFPFDQFQGIEVHATGADGATAVKVYSRGEEPLLQSFLEQNPNLHVHVIRAMDNNTTPARDAAWYAAWARNRLEIMRTFPVMQSAPWLHVHPVSRVVGAAEPADWGTNPVTPQDGEWVHWAWEWIGSRCWQGGWGSVDGISRTCNSPEGFGGIVTAQELGHSFGLTFGKQHANWALCTGAHSMYIGLHWEPTVADNASSCMPVDDTPADGNPLDCNPAYTTAASYRDWNPDHLRPRFVNTLTAAQISNGPPCLQRNAANIMSATYDWVADHEYLGGRPMTASDCRTLNTNGDGFDTRNGTCSYGLSAGPNNFFEYSDLRYMAWCLGYPGFDDWRGYPEEPDFALCRNRGQPPIEDQPHLQPVLRATFHLDLVGNLSAVRSSLAMGLASTSISDQAAAGAQGEAGAGAGRSWNVTVYDAEERVISMTRVAALAPTDDHLLVNPAARPTPYSYHGHDPQVPRTISTSVAWPEHAAYATVTDDAGVEVSRMAPDGAPPTVQLTSPSEVTVDADGSFPIEWTTDTPDAHATLLWFDGDTWTDASEHDPGVTLLELQAATLPAFDGIGMAKVRLSDGFHTVESEPVTVHKPKPLPGVAIAFPENGATLPQGASLHALATGADATGSGFAFRWGVPSLGLDDVDGEALDAPLAQAPPGPLDVVVQGCSLRTLLCANASVTVEILQDSDLDGLSDESELSAGLAPHDPTDATRDSDGDGVSDRDEALAFTAAFEDPHAELRPPAEVRPGRGACPPQSPRSQPPCGEPAVGKGPDGVRDAPLPGESQRRTNDTQDTGRASTQSAEVRAVPAGAAVVWTGLLLSVLAWRGRR